MKKLYLLAVNSAFAEQISANADLASEAILSAFSTSDAAVAAAQILESSSSVMILGTDLSEPIQTLQRLHSMKPDLTVIVLSDPEKLLHLQKSIQFTPFIGKNVRVVSQSDPELIAQEIHAGFTEAARRQRYKELIDSTNRALLVKPVSLVQDSESLKQIFFDRILESAPIGICSVDTAGAILSWNAGARSITARTELQVIGTSFIELFQNQETQRTLRLNFERASSPLESKSVPTVFARTRSNGSDQHLEITIASITGNENGRGSVVIFQDVTDRVNANVAMLEKERQLEEAVHIRDEFLSIASHELKTPLTPLKLQLQRLEMSLHKGETAKITPDLVLKISAVANKQINRLTKLVDDLLDVARITGQRLTLNLEELNFVEFCETVIEQFQEIARQNQTRIQLSVGTNVFIRADQLRLEQVISNLIMNAIKFSAGQPIDIWIGKKEKSAMLCIRDYGIGIEAKDIERIFARFERVDSPSNIGGLGLGLYISRQIVEAHHGKLSVENAKPSGAMFTLQLPL